MSNEDRRPSDPNRVPDTIQVMFVPISIGVAIILVQTQVHGLTLTASYTFAGRSLAVK